MRTRHDEIEAGQLDVILDPAWISALPDEVLGLLCAHCPEAKATLAQSPDTPAALLLRLAGDLSLVRAPSEIFMPSKYYLPTMVSENPACTVAILRALASCSALNIAMNVAEHPSTPADVLEDLARRYFKKPAVVNRTLRNPNSSTALLHAVAELKRTHRFLLTHPAADASLLLRITREGSKTDNKLRKMLAQHPKTPLEALKLLAVSPNPKVAALAAARLPAEPG